LAGAEDAAAHGSREVITRDADDLIEADDDGETDVLQRRGMSDRQARQAYDIAAAAGLDAAFAQRAIAESATLADFRTRALSELARRSQQNPTRPYIAARYGGDDTLDNPSFAGTAIRDALLERLTGKRSTGPAAQFRGMKLLQLGAECVKLRGDRPDWSSHDNLLEQIFRRSAGAHSTSDFPGIVANVVNKRLLDSYQAAIGPWLTLSQERPASDFKPISNLRLSEHPKLQEVKEGTEIKYVTLSEGKETYAVKTYAGLIALTRQLLVNDDLAAFDRMTQLEGQAAAETVNSVFVALFTANAGDGANLADGNPLYQTGRGNKAASGGAIDETTLGLARKAMRETKGLDGLTPIAVAPKHLVVGPAKETQAEKMLAAITPAASDGVNPFAGKLQLHVEPRFTGNAWRMFADPAQVAVLNHSYLSGQEGPQTSTREGWEVLGMEFRVVLDFGAGLVDWRGTYLNSGG
jgi:hypothetical protein